MRRVLVCMSLGRCAGASGLKVAGEIGATDASGVGPSLEAKAPLDAGVDTARPGAPGSVDAGRTSDAALRPGDEHESADALDPTGPRSATASPFDRSSRTRLTRRDLDRFPGETLLSRLGRVVCDAECLPRREFFEAWEVARRTRRRFRGGRVVDLACGHGLVAWMMLLLDDTSPSALAADTRLPPSAASLATAMTRAWPRLAGRVAVEERAIADVAIDAGDVVVATHACGALTDAVLDRVLAARARVALLPCCQDEETCDTGELRGWLDVASAVDVTRAARLRAHGYRVHTQTIPRAITAKNRLLLGTPPGDRSPSPSA